VRRVAAVLAVLLLLTAGCSNARGQLLEVLTTRYQTVDNSLVPNAAPDTRTFQSPDPVPDTANAITSAIAPADRTSGQGGEFLRYRGAIVGIVDSGGGGSYITVDDEDRGRTRWFPIIGGFFGRPGGGGIGGGGTGGVRGGGPGAGK